MNIRALIGTLQRFEKINPNMNVAICIEVSEKGVLGNNNFIFKNIADMDLLLISPTDNHWAEQLANHEWEKVPDEYTPPLLTPCGKECEPLLQTKSRLRKMHLKYGQLKGE